MRETGVLFCFDRSCCSRKGREVIEADESRVRRYGSEACLLRGTWDLPRPGIEPESPALAGGLFPPLSHQGSPQDVIFKDATRLSDSLFKIPDWIKRRNTDHAPAISFNTATAPGACWRCKEMGLCIFPSGMEHSLFSPRTWRSVLTVRVKYLEG